MKSGNADDVIRLCHIPFWVSVFLFFYGTLFPFHVDFSQISLSSVWSTAKVVPYWDVDRGRIHSLPDVVSNILLTIPIGCFGLLYTRKKTWRRVFQWGVFGFALGFTVEIIQLGIPTRVTNITDILNNALGAFGGAALAHQVGTPMRAFLAGIRRDRDGALMFLLFFVLIVFMLAPFDFTFNVSEIKARLTELLIDPWESSRAIQHEWIQMVEFALFGASAGVLARSRNLPFGLSPMRGIIASLSLPIILELGQLFVSSHAPSLRDMLMGLWGVGVGLVCSLYKPTIIHPITGVFCITAGMIAAGLSPYQFVSWELRSDFYWIPLFEYYTRTTMETLYDAGIGIVNFALLAAFIQAAFDWSRPAVIVAVVCLAGSIELAQLLVPGRVAGTTDMIIAALGGWTGVTVWTVVQSETLLDLQPTFHMRIKDSML